MKVHASISVDALRAMMTEHATLSTGKVLVSQLAFEAPRVVPSVGLAFGSLDDEARRAWVAALAPSALVVHVMKAPTEGVRAFLAKFTQRASDGMPLDEACTGLFASGVRELCVYSLEGRRDLLVILGRRA